MLQFPKLLTASVLLLAATGPGMAQATNNPHAYTKPFDTGYGRPTQNFIVAPTPPPKNFHKPIVAPKNVDYMPSRTAPYGGPGGR